MQLTFTQTTGEDTWQAVGVLSSPQWCAGLRTTKDSHEIIMIPSCGHYQTCWVTSVIIVVKKSIFGRKINYSCDYSVFYWFLQLPKSHVIHKTGWIFSSLFIFFFFQKGCVIFGSSDTWESLFRATVRAHLYRGKCIFQICLSERK